MRTLYKNDRFIESKLANVYQFYVTTITLRKTRQRTQTRRET